MAIREIAVFGKALRDYREGYAGTDTKAQKLVASAWAMLSAVGHTQLDPPKHVTLALEAVNHTDAIAHTYHGKSAYEAAVRAAAEEIATWADPPREEKNKSDPADFFGERAAQ